MTTQHPEKRNRRRELYLVAGIIFGVTILGIPFIVHLIMGETSPFIQSVEEPRIYENIALTSPLDVVIEVVWLVIPALFVILALYWIVRRRRRWSGYDEAVKWMRH
ncbi:MAG: hypothetical protein ACFFBU_03630 [Promethearchaeota archaeon]